MCREQNIPERTDTSFEKYQVSEEAESPQAALLFLARHCRNHPAWTGPPIHREVRLPADDSDCSLAIDLDAKGTATGFCLQSKLACGSWLCPTLTALFNLLRVIRGANHSKETVASPQWLNREVRKSWRHKIHLDFTSTISFYQQHVNYPILPAASSASPYDRWCVGGFHCGDLHIILNSCSVY